QPIDERTGDDGIARLGNVVVLSLDEKAGAIGLDVENSAGWNQLAARDFDRSRRPAVRHHPPPAAPPAMPRAPAPPPSAARSALTWSRPRSRHGNSDASAVLWIL